MARIVVAAALICLALAVGAAAEPSARTEAVANCRQTSVGLTPLKDLGRATYKGFGGALYPGASNTPSPGYLAKGMQFAKRVVPRDAGGKPSSAGSIALLSIGMSNTTQEFQAFMQAAAADVTTSSRLRLVDGAQGGQDVEKIEDPASPFWGRVDDRLARAGVTLRQVQVVWLKQAVARETRPFPADAQGLEASLRSVVGILRTRYPNLELVYLSSRTYGGYASTPLNPEPYAYESGFAVKWLVQDAY